MNAASTSGKPAPKHPREPREQPLHSLRRGVVRRSKLANNRCNLSVPRPLRPLRPLRPAFSTCAADTKSAPRTANYFYFALALCAANYAAFVSRTANYFVLAPRTIHTVPALSIIYTPPATHLILARSSHYASLASLRPDNVT